jgi:hypothetical protein
MEDHLDLVRVGDAGQRAVDEGDGVEARRRRLARAAGAHGAEAVGPVTDIMGDLLGWDAARRAAETEGYLELLEADTRALHQLTSVPVGSRETAG